MSLSKKNIEQLKSFLRKDELTNNIDLKNKYSKVKYKPTPIDKSNEDNLNYIFREIIDNSTDLADIDYYQEKLMISENNSLNKNKDPYDKSSKPTNNTKLSEEELLYDEFNYLLEE